MRLRAVLGPIADFVSCQEVAHAVSASPSDW